MTFKGKLFASLVGLLLVFSTATTKAQYVLITPSSIGDGAIINMVERSLPHNEMIDYLRYNSGLPWVPDPAQFDSLFVDRPRLANLIIYHAQYSLGFPDIFGPNVMRYFYSYNTRWQAGQVFPDLKPNSNLIAILFDQSIYGNTPSRLPTSWSNGKYITTIYLRNCAYTTAQMNQLIIDYEAICTAGLGSLAAGVHYLYLNGTGTGANATPTIANFTSTGWVNTTSGKYLSKTINGKVRRVYYN